MNYGVAESSRARVYRVGIGGICNYVDLTSFPSHGVSAESNAAIGEFLAIGLPVGVAAPTIVDRVSGLTGIGLSF